MAPQVDLASPLVFLLEQEVQLVPAVVVADTTWVEPAAPVPQFRRFLLILRLDRQCLDPVLAVAAVAAVH